MKTKLTLLLTCVVSIIGRGEVLPLLPVGNSSSQETAALQSIFTSANSARQEVAKGSAGDLQRHQIAAELDAELETFLTNNVESTAWVPGIHAFLGADYNARGQTTKALLHWQTVWESTKTAENGNAKTLGDRALANLTRMLLALGKTDELSALYNSYAKRPLDGGFLSQMWVRTQEKHLRMVNHPKDTYKCGVDAIDQVAQTLHLRYKRVELLRERSQTIGFTLQELRGLSEKYSLGLVPVLRSENSSSVIVPSVVHWQQNHYAAIVAKRGDLYEIADSSGFGVRWLTAAEIAAEASGYFMVPENKVAEGFGTVSAQDAARVIGRGGGCAPDDIEDTPCFMCPCPPGLTGPNNTGNTENNNNSGCKRCVTGSTTKENPVGMPQWRVSEPYINLWLHDVPLHYKPAKGPDVKFMLNYQQRCELGDAYGWSTGNWRCGWQSFARRSTDSWAFVQLPSGGWFMFSFPGDGDISLPDNRNNAWAEKLKSGGDLIGYLLHFPDGTSLKYTQYTPDYFYEDAYFVTEQIDAQGNKLAFNYTTNNVLTSVTDADGNQTTLNYADAFNPTCVTSISTPDSRQVFLTYNDSAQLTNIVDAAGISSSMTYGDYGWPATLSTPYGSTSFALGFTGDWGRSALITLPDGAKEAFVLFEATTNMPINFSGSQLPAGTPFATGGMPYGTIDTNRQGPNTYYWNPQQFAALGSTNIESFAWSEFKRGRIRHWLMGPSSFDLKHTGYTLGWEQSPSPDGSVEGLLTWYDHTGVVDPEMHGTQVLPAVTARVMPDGTTWWLWEQRNDIGHPTNVIEKWESGGSTYYRTNQYLYAENGIDLLAHTNAMGVLVQSNVFNAYHQVTTSYNALGEATTYSYNGSHQITSISHPSGLTTTSSYDGSGRLEKTVDVEITRTNSYSWYTSGNLQTHTDERGMAVTYFWDGLNRPTGRLFPDGTTTTNLYTVGATKILDLTAFKDRLNFWNYFGYDSRRRKIAETNANSVVTRYGYCECGSIATVTNAWNTAIQQVTTMNYDFQGNPLVTQYADGYAVTNWFNALGKVVATGDGWGNNWFGYDYDNLGLLTSVTNGVSGVEKRVIYDLEDEPIYLTDANGVTITNSYDDLGRLVARYYPDSGVERFGYSPRGLLFYTNQLNQVTRYAYDEARRKVAETNANSEVIRFTYNPAGDLLTLVDGKNQTNKWKYDLYGRVTNKVDQGNLEIFRYKYDANNRLTNRWSVAKGTTVYSYDNVGNLVLIAYPSSPNISYSYDALNRLTNMIDATGWNQFTWTDGNQLLTENGPLVSDVITNTYVNRQRTGLSLQGSVLWTNGFAYDAAKRLTNVASPAGNFGYNYINAASRLPRKISLPPGAYITNAFDAVARLLSTGLRNSSHTILNSHDYVYNPGNQRTQQTFANASTVDYVYDNIGQLKLANSSINSEDRGYLYDAAWNLLTRTNAGVEEAFTVDTKNQLDATPYGNASYDDNGNLIRVLNGDLETYWAYDDDNQLTYYYDMGLDRQFGFAYDGMGRLRRSWEWVWDDGEENWVETHVTYYIYDGKRVIQERSDDTGTVSYTLGSDLSGSMEGAGGIGGILARSEYASSTWTNHAFYHTDGNGNVTQLIDVSQSCVASYRYDPFGNTVSQSGSLANTNLYRFSSKRIHPVTGMYYYGYRWYAPAWQRWLNRDPLGEQGGINLYGFVLNAPLLYYDAFGHKASPPPVTPLPPPVTPMDNCDQKQKDEIDKAQQSACDKINQCSNGKCNQAQLQALKAMCKSPNKPKVRCAKAGDKTCADADPKTGQTPCAYENGNVITLCDRSFPSDGSKCPGIGGPGTLDCLIIHEMVHAIPGSAPDDANRMQKCMGCPQGMPH